MSTLNATPLDSSKALRLQHLDQYSLLDIFDHLDFKSMINLADTSKHFRQLIAARYMTTRFHIDEKSIQFSTRTDAPPPPNTIKLADPKIILNLLRNFGDLITNLKFAASTFNKDAANEINKLIAEYTANTLKALELSDPIGNLDRFPDKVFPKLTRLQLGYTRHGDQLQINATYPALEELFYSKEVFRSTTHAQFYPNLKHFRLDEYSTIDTQNDSALRHLLQLNPQLRLLELSRCSSYDFFKFINQHLVNLESLTVHFDCFRKPFQPTDNIHFSAIRKLKVIANGEDVEVRSLPFTFDRLQHLEILTVAYDLARNFVTRNKALKSLSVPWLEGIKVLHLLRAIKESHSLEQLTMQWRHQDENWHLIRLMTEFETLQTITFVVYEEPDSANRQIALSTLAQNNDWQVTNLYDKVKNTQFDIYSVTLSRIGSRLQSIKHD